MAEETALTDPEEIERLQRQLAGNSNERVDTFSMMPSVTVNNASQDPEKPSEFKPGDIVQSIKTDAGYENKALEHPFKGIIVLTRMFLRTKYSMKEKGAPAYISDEFDSYADSETITIKKKNIEGEWELDFQGNYKQVTEKYADRNSFGKLEKWLDLQYNLYVCTDLDEKRVFKVIAKGVSRGHLFDYMKRFTRRQGDYMSAHWTEFDSEEVKLDYTGKPLKFPVWAFKYNKGDMLEYADLKKAVALQEELKAAIEMREAAFSVGEKVEQPSAAELPQGSPEEDIPIIDLDKEEKEELPKDAQGNEVPFK